MIEDMQHEKTMLQNELKRILENQFDTRREDEYQKQIALLNKQISELENQVKAHINDKLSLNSDLQDLHVARISEISAAKSKVEAELFNALHEIEQLKSQIKAFSRNGEISLSEIEEALGMLRLKRERGLTLDFLIQLDSAAEDKRMLQELRVQFAQCAQELEKATKLLEIQERISKDYKIQVDQVKKQSESMKNEYELRLEENAQLLDLRSQRISRLEAQLKNIAYGVSKVPEDAVELAGDGSSTALAELARGQTAIEVHIDTAMFSEDGRRYISQTVPTVQHNDSNLAFFVSVDFFEFETEFTVLGLSWSPRFAHTIRFPVYADDYFLVYLQTKRIQFKVFLTNSTDFFLHVLGKIDCDVLLLTPIVLAIRAFKERTVALNLLQVSDATQSWETHKSRDKTNSLVISVESATILSRGPSGESPRIYGVISFGFGIRLDSLELQPCIAGTYSPVFSHHEALQLSMTLDLDRHLRTSQCEIVFCDESFDIFYGRALIPLEKLSLGERIEGEFDLQSVHGMPCGTVKLSMRWNEPYAIDAVPIVSLLDNACVKVEFMATEGVSAPSSQSQNAAAAATSAPLPALTIEIHRLELLLSDPAVDAYFESTTQLFISFDFLGYPLEELETRSMPLGNDALLDFAFTKGKPSVTLEKLILMGLFEFDNDMTAWFLDAI
eukprot:jgi/Hompol1/4522/HPOL_003684-RA